MKLVLAVALLLTLGFTYGFHELAPENSEGMMNHLQGNNYNIYVLFFYDSSATDDKSRNVFKDIESRLGDILNKNPEIFYAKIDHNNQAFRKLESVLGVTSVPAVLVTVHGKGVWLSGDNSYLMTERLNDFLPAFKKSSAHHSNPY